MSRSWNRRQLLQAGITTGIAALAGCSTNDEKPIEQTAIGTPDDEPEQTNTESGYDEGNFNLETIPNPTFTEFMYKDDNPYRALLEDTEINNEQTFYLEYFVREITSIHGETEGDSNKLREVPDPMSEIGGRYIVGTGLTPQPSVNCSLIEVYQTNTGAEKTMQILQANAEGQRTTLNGNDWVLIDSNNLTISDVSSHSEQYFAFSRANNIIGAISVVKDEFSNPESVLRDSISSEANEYGIAGIHVPTLNLLNDYREATIETIEVPNGSPNSEFFDVSFNNYDKEWFSNFIKETLRITNEGSISEDDSFGGLDVVQAFTVTGESTEPPRFVVDLLDSYLDEFIRNDGDELSVPPYKMDVTAAKFDNAGKAIETYRNNVFDDRFDDIRRYRARSCNGKEMDMAEVTRRIGAGTDERGFFVDLLHAVIGYGTESSSTILPDNGLLMRQGDWMIGRHYLTNDAIIQINWKAGQNYAGCGNNSWLPR